MFILELTIVPNSSCNKLIQEESGLKLKVTAAPICGAANQKSIELLAKMFMCPKTSIKLILGNKSKKKKFIFHQLTPEQGHNILVQLINKRFK